MWHGAPQSPLPYRRTQLGGVVIGAITALTIVEAAIFVLVAIATDLPFEVAYLFGAVFVFLIALVVLFGWLSVAVDETAIHLAFGAGLVRRTISIQQVALAEPVRNRWWWGWGIRWTGGGWMWNVSGLDAVEVTYRDSKRFRIGAADPSGLAAAITQAITKTNRRPLRD